MMGNGDIQPWPGERNWRYNLSLGKLAEECNELAGIAVRCMEQGLNESEPVTHVPNRVALAKEMSDVIATMQFAKIQTGVLPDEARINKKIDGYYRWFKMLEDIEAAEAEGRAFDDYKTWYNDAMTAANEAGYAGQDAASVIRAMAQEIAALTNHSG
jgi:hypothetical protein